MVSILNFSFILMAFILYLYLNIEREIPCLEKKYII